MGGVDEWILMIYEMVEKWEVNMAFKEEESDTGIVACNGISMI